MTRATAEGIVLMLIGLAMLSYLLPFSLARNMLATLFIAIALIVIIIMRSITWHHGGTPYDGVLLIGVIVSILYLFSFFAFDRSVLTSIVLVLFAVYYGLMALFISMYGMRHQHLVIHTHLAPDVQGHDFAHDPVFRHGIEPIEEHAPPHHEHHESAAFMKGVTPIVERAPAHHVHKDSHQSYMRGIKPIAEHAPPHHVHKESHQSFMHGVKPIAEHAPPHKRTLLQRMFRMNKAPLPHDPHLEPIPEMQPLHGKVHSKEFTKGVEPIHEVTAEHLHKLGVYSLEPLQKFVMNDIPKKDILPIPLIKPKSVAKKKFRK